MTEFEKPDFAKIFTEMKLLSAEEFEKWGEEERNGNVLKALESIQALIPKRYVNAQTSVTFNYKTPFYLSGAVGTGKTYTAYTIIRNHIMRSYAQEGKYKRPVDLHNVPRLVTRYRNIDGNAREEMIEQLGKGMVIFDDLGAESDSEFSREFILAILDLRWENLSWTGFTSNFKLGNLPYNQRIISRVAGIVGDNRTFLDGTDGRVRHE